MTHKNGIAELVVETDGGEGDLGIGGTAVNSKEKPTKKELIRKLRRLKQLLQDKNNEKDNLHRLGMSVQGEERSEFFRQAAGCTKEIAVYRRQLNRVSRRLRSM